MTPRDYRFVKRVAYVFSQVYAPSEIPAIFYSRAEKRLGYRVARAGGFWRCVHVARGEVPQHIDRLVKATDKTQRYIAARKAAGLCSSCGKCKPKGLGFMNCQSCIDRRRRKP